MSVINVQIAMGDNNQQIDYDNEDAVGIDGRLRKITGKMLILLR